MALTGHLFCIKFAELEIARIMSSYMKHFSTESQVLPIIKVVMTFNIGKGLYKKSV